MKRDKKGIKEKLVKWINRIASKEIEKDKDLAASRLSEYPLLASNLHFNKSRFVTFEKG